MDTIIAERMNVKPASVTCWLLSLIGLFVYIINPGCETSTVYVGCYRDGGASDRVMQAVGEQATLDMTVDVCRQRCLDDSQSTYLGTEWYYECFCDDRYDRLGSLPNSRCNTYCGGNRSQTCGGNRAISVHTVCSRGYYDDRFSYSGQGCTERCHCLNDAVCSRRNGTCPRGCAEGWEGHNCSLDIDECSRRPNPCWRANQKKCINTVGSYNCTCTDGFYETDSKACEDIDECSTTNHRCETDSAVGSCVNTQGWYRCECNAGYRLKSDGKCEDIDECLSNRTHACTQICNNTLGSYTCDCTSGYELQSDRRTCQDIDECATDNAGCQQECNNTVGSFHCYCHPGYEVSNFFSCTDVDECLSNNGGCSLSCHNADGSYTCECRAGYELMSDQHTKSCQDVNECDREGLGCEGLEGNCTNTLGSFQCSCASGHQLLEDGRTCVDYHGLELRANRLITILSCMIGILIIGLTILGCGWWKTLRQNKKKHGDPALQPKTSKAVHEKNSKQVKAIKSKPDREISPLSENKMIPFAEPQYDNVDTIVEMVPTVLTGQGLGALEDQQEQYEELPGAVCEDQYEQLSGGVELNVKVRKNLETPQDYTALRK